MSTDSESPFDAPDCSAAVAAASSGGVSPPESCTGTVRELAGGDACATRWLLLAGAVVVCAAGAAVYFLLDPTRVAIFPPCLFHELTGLDCPGCGAQRALHQLLHGNVIAAIRLNAMFVLSLPLVAWTGARFLIPYSRNQPVNFRFRWWGWYLAAWIVFGVLRNVPVAPFSWFAA